MLRIYFIQQWFNLSDPAMEDALYDSEAMRRFAGINPGADLLPDESTILRFRHLLEQHKLSERIFQEVRQLLEERKLLLKSERSSMRRSLPRGRQPRTPHRAGIQR
jgi:transposase, IS5 family